MMASQVYDTRFAQFSRDLKVKATNGECTLMLRGIACRLTQEELKGILDDVGLCGKFSFVYVPRILARRSNLGYAFVRFRSTGFAEECFWSCHGRPLGPAAPDKLCEVTVAKVLRNKASTRTQDRGTTRALRSYCSTLQNCDAVGLAEADDGKYNIFPRESPTSCRQVAHKLPFVPQIRPVSEQHRQTLASLAISCQAVWAKSGQQFGQNLDVLRSWPTLANYV